MFIQKLLLFMTGVAHDMAYARSIHSIQKN